MNKYIFLCLILVIVTFNAESKKKLYKWVDENGQVHFSDNVPANQIKKEHEEVNENGVVIEKVAKARTKEEIQAEKDEKARLLAIKKEEEKDAKRRLAIIKSYTNESEIVRLKEERMSALERNIELANQSLAFQKESREQLLTMAADQERNGQEISNALKSRIETIEEKIEYQFEYIKVKEQEMQKVNEKFKSDLAIYREAINHKRKVNQ